MTGLVAPLLGGYGFAPTDYSGVQFTISQYRPPEPTLRDRLTELQGEAPEAIAEQISEELGVTIAPETLISLQNVVIDPLSVPEDLRETAEDMIS